MTTFTSGDRPAAFAAELRAMWAGVRKDLRGASRYPLGMINMVLLAPLYSLVIPVILFGSTFAVDRRPAGLVASAGTADLAGFVFTGGFINVVAVGTFFGVTFMLSMERTTGTLEQCWLTPARRGTFAAQFALTTVLISLAGGVLLAVIGALGFGARFLGAVVLAVPILAIMVVGLLGVGLLVGSVLLRLREAKLLIDGSSFLFAMFSCTMFPIGVMPAVLRPVSLALPTTYAMDVLRHHALGTRLYLPLPAEYALCAATSVLMLAVGAYVFSRTERSVARRGSVGQH
jgi:ABC-2 type transport system permease protein